MKNIFFIISAFIVFQSNALAGSEKLIKTMHYETSYEKALEKAKNENKPIMMVIGQENCPYCGRFEVRTLTKDVVHTVVEQNFIPLSVLRGIDSFPEQFQTKGVPTVIFINPIDQSAIYKTFGYVSKKEYLVELQRALEFFKKRQE